jgi:uncharacterized protein YjdB
MRALAGTRAAALGLLVVTAVVGCRDGLLHEPARETARLSVQPSLGQAAGGVLEAYAKADVLALSFAQAGEVRLSETQSFDGTAELVRLTVQVPLRAASETFTVAVELRRGADPLFRGSAQATLSSGQTTPLELPLGPVIHQVACEGDVVELDAFGASTTLTAAALFATGDTIPGLPIQWTSSNPAIATVSQAGVVTAVSDGQATIQCTSAGVAGSRAVRVAAAIASVVVTPEFAEIEPGETQQFTAVLRDRLGNVVTGRDVAWTVVDPQVASIDGNGLALGLEPGSTEVRATSGGVTGSAMLSVLRFPPIAITGAVTGIQGPSAVFNGTVNPQGDTTVAWFEWGTSSTLTSFNKTQNVNVGNGETAVPTSATVSNLVSGTTYYVRVAASNGGGVSRGAIVQFRSAIYGSPDVITESAYLVSSSEQFGLIGSARPNGSPTDVWFEWGTSDDPGLIRPYTTQKQYIGDGDQFVEFSDLVPLMDETVWYRAVAANEFGIERGEIKSYNPFEGMPRAAAVIDGGRRE